MKTTTKSLLVAVLLATATPAFADISNRLDRIMQVTGQMAEVEVRLQRAMPRLSPEARTRLMTMRARAIEHYRHGELESAADILARMLSDSTLGGR